MKCLSIKQPFAELIVSGRKKIELRSWNTNFRDKFYVHASKKADKKAMKKFCFEKLDLGKIIGTVELVKVKKYDNKIDFGKDKKKHLSDSE